METKMLCDRCKREFTGSEELMEELKEVVCPDCLADAAFENDI